MRLRLIVIGLGVAGVMSFGVFAAGCGSDDETSSTPAASSDEATEEPAEEESAATATPTAGGETLKIEMGEFYFKPEDVTAKAGTITIDAPNVGNAPHELVLAKTNDDPAKLPTASDGSVDEDSLDVPGEVEEVEAGADGTVTLDLQAGKYVMFCNLPGHYQGGMYGSLTVK
jgi:uncharacterized cupredoxin-like copper-binding protein